MIRLKLLSPATATTEHSRGGEQRRLRHKRLLWPSGTGDGLWGQIKASRSDWWSLIPKWSSKNWKRLVLVEPPGFSEDQTGWDAGRSKAHKRTQTGRRGQLIYKREGLIHRGTGDTQNGSPAGEQMHSWRSGLNHHGKKAQLNTCIVAVLLKNFCFFLFIILLNPVAFTCNRIPPTLL